MCDWLKFCKFCIYNAVYRLCPKYMKSFIPHAILSRRKYRFVVRIKKLTTELRICKLLHEDLPLYL